MKSTAPLVFYPRVQKEILKMLSLNRTVSSRISSSTTFCLQLFFSFLMLSVTPETTATQNETLWTNEGSGGSKPSRLSGDTLRVPPGEAEFIVRREASSQSSGKQWTGAHSHAFQVLPSLALLSPCRLLYRIPSNSKQSKVTRKAFPNVSLASVTEEICLSFCFLLNFDISCYFVGFVCNPWWFCTQWCKLQFHLWAWLL